MQNCAIAAASRCWNSAGRARRLKSSSACWLRAPDHLDALGNRANALFKLNRPVEAIELYDRALKLEPGNAPLLTNRAIALRRLERPHEALMSAKRALAAQPDFAPARFVDSDGAALSRRFRRRLAWLRMALGRS